MSKRLMPTYLVNFLKEIYDGTIPSNFGERMVSRQFIASVKTLYETLGGTNPSDYSRRMVNEYLIKFFNEIEIVEYTDDDVLMTKTISSDLVYPACRIDAIGGMSYKSENLIVLSDVAETTDNGITYKVENGVLYFNGTATETTTLDFDINLFTIPTAKDAGGNGVLYFGNNQAVVVLTDLLVVFSKNSTPIDSWSLSSINRIVTSYSGMANKECNKISLKVEAGVALNNLTIKLMFVNNGRTDMSFEEGFAGIRDSAVTAVKAYNTDNELLDTYTVPSAITSLEGYGQGNPDDPTVYNEVNFIDGKYYEKGYIDNGVWVSKEDEISITEQAPLLECEDSGSIVFENTYNQDMPNEVTTWIKES